MSQDQSANLPLNSPDAAANLNGARHPNPDDVVLYAMQLLSPEEAATIANHLERCAPCRGELSRILGDLATYTLTVDLESPPALARRRLLQQVAREKKIVSTAPSASAQPESQPRSQAQPSLASFGRSGSVLSMDDAPPKPRASRAVLAWSGWAVAAGLAIGVSFLKGDRRALREDLAAQDAIIQRLNDKASASHQLMDALTDPLAMHVTLTSKPHVRTGPIAGVTYNPDKGSLVFLASDLDPLQSYKTYELWIIPQDGAAPVPAGTFHPDNQGSASIVMPELPRGIAAKAFGVTIEDDGGAQTPTLPIIMAGS